MVKRQRRPAQRAFLLVSRNTVVKKNKLRNVCTYAQTLRSFFVVRFPETATVFPHECEFKSVVLGNQQSLRTLFWLPNWKSTTL